jgi:hypothetical protein
MKVFWFAQWLQDILSGNNISSLLSAGADIIEIENPSLVPITDGLNIYKFLLWPILIFY